MTEERRVGVVPPIPTRSTSGRALVCLASFEDHIDLINDSCRVSTDHIQTILKRQVHNNLPHLSPRNSHYDICSDTRIRGCWKR